MFLEKCYVHNIFTTNHRWLVVIGSNLNLTLRLLFCPNNNNLPFKICCKNVVDILFLMFLILKNVSKSLKLRCIQSSHLLLPHN